MERGEGEGDKLGQIIKRQSRPLDHNSNRVASEREKEIRIFYRLARSFDGEVEVCIDTIYTTEASCRMCVCVRVVN